MKKIILLLVLTIFILTGLAGIFYTCKNKPIILISNEVTIVKHTTNGARARISELEKEGKGPYEIVAVLEDEGYIRELDK